MTPRTPKNIAASVRQRLLNKSKSEGRPFQEILQYYAMERFLYRLSRSAHAEKFILKGALMLKAWHAPELRPTMDIDVLGRTNNEAWLLGLTQLSCFHLGSGAKWIAVVLGVRYAAWRSYRW